MAVDNYWLRVIAMAKANSKGYGWVIAMTTGNSKGYGLTAMAMGNSNGYG